jgi:hypothetical protein
VWGCDDRDGWAMGEDRPVRSRDSISGEAGVAVLRCGEVRSRVSMPEDSTLVDAALTGAGSEVFRCNRGEMRRVLLEAGAFFCSSVVADEGEDDLAEAREEFEDNEVSGSRSDGLGGRSAVFCVSSEQSSGDDNVKSRVSITL